MKTRTAQRATPLIAALCFTLALGCASTGKPPDPNAGTGPTAGDRGQAALEGLLMGAIIGGQMGPIGAAVGAGAMLIYGAVTGNVPLGGGGVGSGPRSEREREADLESQIEDEVQRQASLETEIEAELRRQEELLASIEQDEALKNVLDEEAAPELSAEELAEQADTRAAPLAPKDRDLPEYIFDTDTVNVPKGQWGNRRAIQATRRSLDADRDGKPEEIRYFDEQGAYVRKEEDRDYDGTIDAWSTFRGGDLVTRELDANGDGARDVFEHYAQGRMTRREIDRNHDGKRDAFYDYQNDSLLAERHDTDYDGNVDFRVTYRERRRVSSEEDADKNGQIDTWTTYAPDGDQDAVARIERDQVGDGRPDTFESYARKDGKTVLTKREEDKNGDGAIDIVSIYENGKLVRREISDPAMMPL
ncbi:MAG: hypothetical protein HKP30_08270 [Myxococcales bacterium]|nr:hypothetical protein [Myxococcales bacterium]